MAAPGEVRRIESLSNPLVKEARALNLKKHREASGLFLAEGLKLVRDGLDGGWRARILLHGSEASQVAAAAEAAARAREQGAEVVETTSAVLAKIARRDNPQAVIGVFEQRAAPLDAVGREGLWIALDRVRDPGNLGTILRTADAVGAAGVVLVGESCDPFSVEAVRSTMGSIFHVPLAQAQPDAFLDQVRRAGARLVGTHLAGSRDYRAADYSAPCVLLMGNEQQGLTDHLAGACDALVRIPMRGRADLPQPRGRDRGAGLRSAAGRAVVIGP